MILYFISGIIGVFKMVEYIYGSLGFGYFVIVRYWYISKCNCFEMKIIRYDFLCYDFFKGYFMIIILFCVI